MGGYILFAVLMFLVFGVHRLRVRREAANTQG